MTFKLLVRPSARAIAAMALIAGAVACKGSRFGQADGEIAQTWTPAKATASMNIPIADVSAAISKEVADSPPSPVRKDTWSHAQRLYKNYNNAPLWLTEEGLDKPRAGALMLALADGTTDGLRLQDYPLAALGAAIDSLSNNKTPTAEQLADIDVMLTATYVSLGEDLMSGQIDPKSVNQSWNISGKEEKVDSALFRSIRADQLDKAIALMRPRDDGYDSLRVQLAKYRELAAKEWVTVPDGKPLSIGQADSPARIAALKARLTEEGYFVDSAATAPAPTKTDTTPGAKPQPAVFTREIARAVGQFQAHHGIPVDSSLGTETLQAMNVPASYRAAQIATNLERYRWLPRAFGERYIMVNVPAFKLVAYDSGKQVLEMKVIVGQDYEGKSTPVFADTMQYVVFRPYWNVTPNIQEKEFAGKELPAGFEYFQDGGKARIRQVPGPKNALGLVKFLFPNDFNIYLHDTPNDDLFKKDVRAFSHGCIRLEKPDELANYVLGWDMSQVHEAMNGADNRTITLKKPIPVFIVYFTAFVTDGQVYFGNDLYKRDGSMVEMMAPGALPSEDALRALRALHAIAERWGVRNLNH